MCSGKACGVVTKNGDTIRARKGVVSNVPIWGLGKLLPQEFVTKSWGGLIENSWKTQDTVPSTCHLLPTPGCSHPVCRHRSRKRRSCVSVPSRVSVLLLFSLAADTVPHTRASALAVARRVRITTLAPNPKPQPRNPNP